MAFLEVDGSEIFYEDTKDGSDVLVCIHGFISSSLCWHPLVEHLSTRFRVIAFDLPGFGKTLAAPNFQYTLANYGALTSKFVMKLGLTKVHILGHSLGGQIALHAAKNCPELYDKLFLIAASAQRKRPSWLARLFCYFPFIDDAAYKFYFQDPLVNIGISKVLAGGVGLEKNIIQPYIDMCKKKEVIQAVLELGKDREDDMNERDVAEISHKTYLLWGREDQVVLLQEGEFLNTHLKHSTLAIIEHCGHLPMEEYPLTVLHHIYTFFFPNYKNIKEK